MEEINNPLVSVIMPAYNRAHVIGRAIISVLEQAYTNFELIIVDDGSKDNTEEVVKSFGDPRIRFTKHEQNRGVCAARNTGIRASRGEYITFIDSDDEMAPLKLQEQLQVFTRQSGIMNIVVVTGVLYLEDGAKPVTTKVESRPCPRGDISRAFFATGRNIPKRIVTMMVRKEYLDEVGLFDETLRASEFWDLGVRLSKRCNFEVIEAPLDIVHRDAGPRSWNIANRVQAMPLLLKKYRDDFTRYPKAAANVKLVLGVLQLRSGLRKEGRQSVLEAWRLYPYLPNIYLYLFCSLLPSVVSRWIAGHGFKYIISGKWIRPSARRPLIQDTAR